MLLRKEWRNLIILTLLSLYACNDILTEVNKLYTKKNYQKADTPAIILREQKNHLSYFLHHNFDESSCYSKFLQL